ncbi:MAG: serine protease, partial [Lentisphaeraceae bacterium]|nr:serine protease [Lentisphaeraceae bacterium]
MKIFSFSFLIFALFFSSAIADPLPQSQRINGTFVKQALEELTEKVNDSIVMVSTLDSNPLSNGVIVKEDGFILTKASEIKNEDIQVVLPNQKRYHAVFVGEDAATDLALLKIKAKDLKPLDFKGDFPQDKATWLVSPLFGLTSKIGIVSSVTRDIKRVSGVIGIMLGEEIKEGIVIRNAVEKGPAHTAGVRAGDILLKVDGKQMLKRDKLLNYLKDKSPGTHVEILVQQNGKEISRKILLGDRNQTFGLFNRNLEMSGVISKRTDGFNSIIQHDIPIEHFDTCSPLMDIDGRVVGLNIAKANRSEAYALPNAEVRKAIDKLIKLKVPEDKNLYNSAKHVSIVKLKSIQDKLKKLLPDASKSTVGLIINGASGSGVIVSEDGYIITAAHVSQDPGSKVTVIMPDGKEYNGESLGNHMRADVGLVKITDEGKFPFVKMAKSVKQKTGDWCFALGYPGGFNKERGAVVRIGKIIEIRPNVVWTDCTLLGGD